MSEYRQLQQRWRAARDWQPDPELVARAARTYPSWAGRPWPGFAPDPFRLAPLPDFAQIGYLLQAYEDFDALNRDHFESRCPLVKMVINPRLRSTGGRIDTRLRVLELNFYRLLDVPESRTEVVFHELIHLWLYAHGLPAGHSAHFKAKMAERGHTSIHFGVPDDPKGQRHAYPGSDRRVIYRCTHCHQEYVRRRAYARPMLCGHCLHGGQGRHRIELVGRVDGADPR